MDDLFHYQYPFRFPDLFEGNLTKYERLVRIEFIKMFNSKDPHKSFNLKQFFNTYRGPLKCFYSTIYSIKLKKLKLEKIMVGYPYFYETDNLNQDENFMIFSLDPISENSELNLAHVSSVPIMIDPSQFKLGDEFSYKFCDQISQLCGSFQVIPETQTLVLDYNGFCSLVSKSDVILSTISSDLGVTKVSAMEQAQKFFQDKNVVVQAGGVQGVVYKAGSYLQSAGSAGLVSQTLALAKLAGVSGLQVLQAQPALAIAIPTTGAMFFYGCGALAGNNTVGKVLVTAGDAFALPMKGVEIMWNSYGNPVIQKVFGIPVILNMTQTFKTGPGYTLQEIRNYIPLNNSSLLKSIKTKIIDWLS